MRIYFAALGVSALLSGAVWAEDLTTLTGETYTHVVVQQYDSRKLFIHHDGGTNSVLFTNILPELRGHYKALSMRPIPIALPSEERESPVGPNDLVTLAGQVFRNVSVKMVEDRAIRIAHDTGMATVNFSAIPLELHKKYRMEMPVTPDPEPTDHDLVSAYGQIFRNVEILLVEPDGLTFRHDGGVTKLGFPALPEELRQKHGYDSVVAWKYGRDKAAKKMSEQQKSMSDSEGVPAPVAILQVQTEILPDNAFRIRFAVQNLTDEEQSIQFSPLDSKMGALISSRSVEIRPRAEGKLLQIEIPAVQPHYLSISCGAYRTNVVLSW